MLTSYTATDIMPGCYKLYIVLNCFKNNESC